MNILVLIVAVPAVSYVVFVCVYLAALAIGALTLRTPSTPAATPQRIAVIIPAHNEAETISQVLTDIRSQVYPLDRFACFVVADNCTDTTAELAKQHGAEVMERTDPDVRGKGHALNWALRQLASRESQFDAVVFIDADNRVDPRFLEEISATLADPSVLAVQGRYLMQSDHVKWHNAAVIAGFAVMNHLRPAGRWRWGGSAGLRGTGMGFSTRLIFRVGWPAASLVEDWELEKQLSLRGIRVAYNPNARVWSAPAPTSIGAYVQHTRWEVGRRRVLTEYLPQFLKAVSTHASWVLWDGICDLIVPPVGLLMTALIAIAVTAWVYLPGLGAIAAPCLLMVMFAVGVALVQTRAPVSVWLYLALSPMYLVWKVCLLVRSALVGRRGLGWNRTPRS